MVTPLHILGLCASLTLAQADVQGSRADDVTRPVTEAPRAELQSGSNASSGATDNGATVSADDEPGTGGAGRADGGTNNVEGTGGAGAGTAATSGRGVDGGTPLTPEQARAQKDEQEKAELREQLNAANEKLSEAVEAQQQTAAELAQVRQTLEEEQAARQQREAQEDQRRAATQARQSSLGSAQSLSTGLAPDVLHDSTEYANAIDAAQAQVNQARAISDDVDTELAAQAVAGARDAYDNGDLMRMSLWLQQARMYLEAARGR